MNEFKSVFAIILLVSGIYLSNRHRWFQLSNLGASIRTCLDFRKQDRGIKKKSDQGLTPFQALATALGGSIGTANIAGVAGAIVIGGPGAIFWMWFAAIIGMGVKFSEIVLAIKYRERTDNGYIGGAMLYIEKGLGKRRDFIGRHTKPLACCFAVFGALAALFGTTLVQSNTIALSACDLFFSVSPEANWGIIKLISGAITAVLVGIVVIGGVQRIGKASEIIVPFMALGYVLVCIIALYRFRSGIIPAFKLIFEGAFAVRSAAGGFVGFGIVQAFRTGVARGVYSNEAGIGSAPMAHACANTTDPVKQGLYGIFEVFADTIIICTMSALVLLASNTSIPFGEASASGTRLMLFAFQSAFSGEWVGYFLSFSIILFAYTSILGWAVYGRQCISYLFGKKSEQPFAIVYTLLCIVGAIAQVDAVWTAGECLNFLMAIPNLLALILLSGEVRRESLAYSQFSN